MPVSGGHGSNEQVVGVVTQPLQGPKEVTGTPLTWKLKKAMQVTAMTEIPEPQVTEHAEALP